MKNVMAHTLTVNVRVEKPRATQLYTEKIVRCILRGVTNQMLINNVYGRRFRPKVMEEEDYYKSKSCACVIMNDYECNTNVKTINEQLFINFITRRDGVKVKLRLYPLRGSLLVDPDPVEGRLKVKSGCYLRRWCALTDPDSPRLISVFAMAGTDLVIPSAAKGISLLKSTLSLIQEKKQEHNLPAPFSTYEEANFRGYKDKDLDEWLDRVKISPPVVVALAFVMNRSGRIFVTHAIRLLMKMLSKVTNENELEHVCHQFHRQRGPIIKIGGRGRKKPRGEGHHEALMHL